MPDTDTPPGAFDAFYVFRYVPAQPRHREPDPVPARLYHHTTAYTKEELDSELSRAPQAAYIVFEAKGNPDEHGIPPRLERAGDPYVVEPPAAQTNKVSRRKKLPQP